MSEVCLEVCVYEVDVKYVCIRCVYEVCVCEEYV